MIHGAGIQTEDNKSIRIYTLAKNYVALDRPIEELINYDVIFLKGFKQSNMQKWHDKLD